MIGPIIGYEDMPILSLDKKGKAPRERLTKASVLRGVFTRQREDDIVNAANRAECQGLLDGQPPHSDSELKEAGLDITNVNWRGAEEKLERAMAPYYRLTYSTENLLDVRTTYGPREARVDLNAALSEEITRMLRRSAHHRFHELLRIQKKIKEGLGFAYFPDHLDWRFRAAGLGQFFFDRQKFVYEDDQEIVTSVEPMNITDLYGKVSDKDGNLSTGYDKEAGGWNPETVISAIQKARSDQSNWQDWERMADELKNNDLMIAMVSPPVNVVHGWVKEFDGWWSHYITTEEDCGTEEFLYKSRRRFRSLSEMLVMFPDGLGTNAKIHGMRGLLYKMFPAEQQRNRSINRLIDAGVRASSLVLKAETEEALSQAGLTYVGDTAVVGPEWTFGNVTMPDLQRSVMPSIELMDRLRNDRTAGYSPENVFDGDQRKTKGEVYAHLEHAATLSEAGLDIEYGPRDTLYQQMVRRMIRPTYVPQDPGGREVADLMLRLLKRGGDELLKAFHAIDWAETRAVRAIGGGSAAAKTVALDRMAQPAVVSQMDDRGRHRLARAISIDAVGAANADDFIPADPTPRTDFHTDIASLENELLLGGKELPVRSHHNHLAHAREHAAALAPLIEAEKNGQVPIEEMAVMARPLWLHGAEHVDNITGDADTIAEAGQLRQFFQQAGEPIENGLKRAATQAGQESAEGGPEQGGGPSPEQIAKVEAQRQELTHKQEMFDLAKQQKIEMAQVDIAIKDATAAAQIARSRQLAMAQQGKKVT